MVPAEFVHRRTPSPAAHGGMAFRPVNTPMVIFLPAAAAMAMSLSIRDQSHRPLVGSISFQVMCDVISAMAGLLTSSAFCVADKVRVVRAK